MISDSDMISTVSRLKREGLGILKVQQETNYALEDIIAIWDKCGPPGLSQGKITSIKEGRYLSFRAKAEITESELERIASETGVSKETARKIIAATGTVISENYSRPDLRTAGANGPDLRTHKPQITCVSDLSADEKDHLNRAFLNRYNDERMAEYADVPISVCRIYRGRLQGAYANIIHLKKHLKPTSLLKNSKITLLSKRYRLDETVIEKLVQGFLDGESKKNPPAEK